MNIQNISKVVCIGRNYIEHIKELDNETPKSPVIFIKPNTSITDKINLPKNREIHYECEIVLKINSDSKIIAVGVGLDLTDRSLQSKLKAKGLPWELAKGFDGATILSDFVEINENDIPKLSMKAYKNNELVQHANYDLMIYKPQQILEYLKEMSISLTETDCLMTGTPKGVGIIEQTDTFKLDLYLEDKIILSKEFKG